MSVSIEHTHTKVDIDKLINSMESSLSRYGSSSSSQRCNIVRVTPHVRNIDPTAYDPKILSIGPLHRGRDGLQAMEKLKWQHLHRLLLRNRQNHDEQRYNEALKRYVTTIERREQELRGQYAEDTRHLCSSQFVEMMVLDGCFIIELLINYNKGEAEKSLSANNWNPSLVRMDLLLLENQIPFPVLQSLYDLSVIDDFKDPEYNRSQTDITLMILAVFYLTAGKRDGVTVPFENGNDEPVRSERVHHLLHLLHLTLRPDNPWPEQSEHRSRRMPRTLGELAFSILYLPIYPWIYRRKIVRCLFCLHTSVDKGLEREPPKRIPSASELRAGWVHFRVKKGWRILDVDVTFKNGCMEMRRLDIEDITNPMLQNLIALEQSMPELPSYYSSYAWFMDNLIDTPADVAILREKGIIQSNLGSDKEVATYFNKLCRGHHLDYKNHYLAGVFEDLNKHHRDPRNRWCAGLMEAHFKNPWTITAIVWAVLTLLLAGVQTIFTVWSTK